MRYLKNFKFIIVKSLCILILLSIPIVAKSAEEAAEEPTAWTPLQISIWNPVQLFSEERNVYGIRTNVFYGKNHNIYGLDIGLFTNECNDINGFQISTLCNLARGHVTGSQIGYYSNLAENITGLQMCVGLNSADNLNGLQLSLFNNFPTDKTKTNGIQIGFINFCERVNGIQIGLFNYCKRMNGIQIGVINIINRGPIPFLPIINFSMSY